MAIPIKSIPELKGKLASEFVKMATANVKKMHSVDFSKQAEKAKKIIEKFNNCI